MTLPRRQLDKLWAQGKEFLGTELSIMGGAMSWISERHLVSAISNAGGFGVLACGSMMPEQLEEEISATTKMTSKPFGVNIITMHPELNNLIDVCGKQKISHIVLAGGLPNSTSITRARDTGAKVICFAPALILAKKLIHSGAQALIIEGTEAGGHIGPVSTSVLVQEILPEIADKIPVFVAGGIGRGETIINYLELGAAGVQLGSRFVCANECIAHPNFKKSFIRGQARNAMPTIQADPTFPVIPVRTLPNKATVRFVELQHEVIAKWRSGELEQKQAQLEIEHFWAGALKKAAIDGDVENGSLMAGQSVGMVTKEQPCSEIIQELLDQAMMSIIRRM